MKNMVLVYGSYGYTGRLIVDKLLEAEIGVVLSGRNEDSLREMSEATGLEYRVAAIPDLIHTPGLFNDIAIFVHCAGPFIYTARQAAEACIKNNCHYLDITGEYKVFEDLQTLDSQAREAGIMLLPGAGFDVVPTDCLAAKLNSLLPGSENLLLAFATKGGGTSRGTAKTMIESVPDGLIIRENGKLTSVPLGSRSMEIDFGPFQQLCAGLSWGDISTAWFSTGIPNISVFVGTSVRQLNSMKWMGRLSFLFRIGWIKKFLLSRIDKRPPGPGEKKRKTARTYLYGKVSLNNQSAELRLETNEVYSFTAMSVALICSHILSGQVSKGFQTPSSAYGEDFVLNIEGTIGWNR